ncbi:hypothetical protein K0A97_00960 [Patescibacteria group bacterium]|nr:hypothetical protein [Patescibacteria group bacterium]
MVDIIPKIIAAINPDRYYKPSGDKEESKNELRKFKEIIKSQGIQKAIEKAKPTPLSTHKLVYDSSSETLEPVYFFIVDLMNDFGLNAEKLIDNFTSSPGSGHFAELGQRATVMQQQGSKILGDINTVLRSVLNIIYDLKEFRIRLSQYDDLKTERKESAVLALKQIWLDKVDIQKGNSSIKAMALGNAGFQTLLDAFLVVDDEKNIGKVDLNDRVIRILRPRLLEFNQWLEHSEKELRKRYELEKTYLKSQVNSLKLYSRWAKPYLRAAQELEMSNLGRDPGLVKAFNTIILELTLLGKNKIKSKEEAISGNLPLEFKKVKTKDYYACVLISFRFRGIPQRVSQQPHYVFGGRVEISFNSYALNEDELKKFEECLEESDLNDALRLIEGSTGESLTQMQDEIDFFLNEKDKEVKTASQKDYSNPFMALFGKYGGETTAPKKEIKKEVKSKVIIRQETYPEKQILRPFSEEIAKEITFKLFDIYKKAHGMASYT